MSRRFLALLVVSLLAATVFAAAPASAAPTSGAAEIEFLQLLNKQRAAAGLDLVVMDTGLSNIARSWSSGMASRGLSHNPSLVEQVEGNVTRDWRRIGENVGYGPRVGPLHRAFWDSVGHRDNLLGSYNRVGIGVVVSGGNIWVTFDFLEGPGLFGSTGVNACGNPGYILDGYGGVHSLGGSRSVRTSGYWPGWDIARDLTIRPAIRRGYVLDGFGGLHPVGGARRLRTTGYWRGWDIARAAAVLPEGGGAYVLDGFGGVHPAGDARRVRTTGYWPGADVARDIQLAPERSRRGYVLDNKGGLHPFGRMPRARTSWYGGSARSFSFLPDGSGGFVADNDGNLHPFAVGDAPMPGALDSPIPMGGARVLGGVIHRGAVAFVTASGAEIGINRACARSARWGGDIARAVVSR